MHVSTTARLLPAPRLVVRADGTVLIGGDPTRLMRLSDRGATLVAAWFGGQPVGAADAHQRLAHRLIEAGLAVLVTGSSSGRPSGNPKLLSGRDYTVIIPVRDDVAGLARTLRGINRSVDSDHRPIPVTVVDDGSAEPVLEQLTQQDLVEGAGALSLTVIRQTRVGGPAKARNAGLGTSTAAVTVFVDAGVLIDADTLDQLANETLEANTVATAPRVVSAGGLDRQPDTRSAGRFALGVMEPAVADYERRWSPLDLGPQSGLVGPNRRLSYVPSTCLAVRNSELKIVAGFDSDLRYGEDVDLVWRLSRRGWVRYLADVEVTHPPRRTVRRLAGQRFHYGTAAGPLADRHGWAPAAVRLSPAMTATWLTILAGRRFGPVGVALLAIRGRPRFRPAPSADGGPPSLAEMDSMRLAAAGLVSSGRGLATAAVRPWWPVLAVVAYCFPGLRRRVATVVALGWLRRLGRRPWSPSRAALDIGLGVIDDSAYGLGVVTGSVRSRNARPLLPHVTGRYWAMNRSRS